MFGPFKKKEENNEAVRKEEQTEAQTEEQQNAILNFAKQVATELHKGASEDNQAKSEEMEALYAALSGEINAEGGINYGKLVVQAIKGLLALPEFGSVIISLPFEGLLACLLYLLNWGNAESKELLQAFFDKLIAIPTFFIKVVKKLGTDALSVIKLPKIKPW